MTRKKNCTSEGRVRPSAEVFLRGIQSISPFIMLFTYDIEMQTTNERNLPERMRYYQYAIDNSAINKGGDYNDLPDTFIIFLCTFDYLKKDLPVYTIKPYCTEAAQTFNDGTTKIIVNSKASKQAEENPKAFLSYMNGQSPNTAFTKTIEEKINKAKEDE